MQDINPLNGELNPICHLLALIGAHHILHVSRIRVNDERMSWVAICLRYEVKNFAYCSFNNELANTRVLISP